MKKYVIERDIPEAGKMSDLEAIAAAQNSNAALAQLAQQFNGSIATWQATRFSAFIW